MLKSAIVYNRSVEHV